MRGFPFSCEPSLLTPSKSLLSHSLASENANVSYQCQNSLYYSTSLSFAPNFTVSVNINLCPSLILLVLVHLKMTHTLHLFLEKLFPLRCASKTSRSHFNSTSKRRINAEPLTFTYTTAPFIATSSSWFYHRFCFLSR